MSRRQSYTLIVSCLLFTGFLFASIELGEGLKCYVCNSRQSDCTNNLGKIEDCSTSLTTTTTQSSTSELTTQSSSTSESEPTIRSSSISESETTIQASSISESESTSESKLDLAESDFISNGIQTDWLEELSFSENITYECFEIRTTIQNRTSLKNEVNRGCFPKNKLTCGILQFPDVQVKSCVIKTCESDNCNSSSMEKMGIVSLVLPLITALLRIR